MKPIKNVASIVYILIGIIIFLLGFVLVLFSIIDLIKSEPNLRRSSVTLAIGGSLLASGVVYFLDLIRNRYASFLKEKINNVIFDAGIIKVYYKRDLDNYDSLIKGMDKSLDISGYSLNGFLDSYADIICKKLIKGENIRIRILMVNPLCHCAKQREQLEGRNVDAFKESVNRVIKTFVDFPSIEIRLIDSPITSMFYRIDNNLYIGPHLFKKASKATVTYELDKKGELYGLYQEDFDNMWNSAIKQVNAIQ